MNRYIVWVRRHVGGPVLVVRYGDDGAEVERTVASELSVSRGEVTSYQDGVDSEHRLLGNRLTQYVRAQGGVVTLSLL